YTPWCDEAGKVVDDGTVARLDETAYRWTAAEPQLRWLRLNATGLDVDVEEISEAIAAVAVQGPLSRAVLEAAAGQSFADLRFFRRRPARVAGIGVDVSRTGYTGDLGYELWVESGRAPDLWDALLAAGAPFGVRAAGMLALDVVRIEAGFILLDVDYTSSRAAVTPEQAYSPFEIGLGRLVDLAKREFVGRRALVAEHDAGGPPRRLVGLGLDWLDVERLYAAQGLPPSVPAAASRTPVPLFGPGGRQVGRVSSTTWSALLKQLIALGSVEAGLAEPGTRLAVELTVEAHRGRVGATVVPLPFFDPPRKRA
ncbi:MAG: aminomethyltransferase family protein, partial [Candidatus Limnocylindrales bacterium]